MRWDFDSSSEGWGSGNSITSSVQSGILEIVISGSDPYIYSPNNLGIDASILKTIKIRAKNLTNQNAYQLYWITDTDQAWGGNGKQISIGVTANSSGQNEYLFDLSSVSAWDGTVTRVRLDFGDAAIGDNVAIDYIQFSTDTYTLTADNGILKVKANLLAGGAMSYISKSAENRNLVNIYDKGRYIQQSYYAGAAINRIAEGQHPSWSPWNWNPIQAGDVYNNYPPVLETAVTDSTIYTKTVPLLWDMNNEAAECLMETWLTLIENTIHVKNKLTIYRTDSRWTALARHQELPAVYVIGDLHNLYAYKGNSPWTNGLPEKINNSGPPWTYWASSEHWAALVDDNNWGVGVFNKNSTYFVGGYHGPNGGTSNSASTGYMSPLVTETLGKNTVYEYEYDLIVGTLTEIRNFAYIKSAPSQNANFTTGNLVVARVGEGGSTTLGTNGGAVYLDEYNPVNGSLVNTVSLPVESQTPNHRIVIGRAASSTHGFLTLSPDGRYLTIAGYDEAVGTALTTLQAGTTGRVFAVVSNGVSSPLINTSTRVTLANGDNRVAVTSDGNSIWFGGTSQGVHYTTLGSTSSLQVSSAPTPTRGGLAIFGGQLYQSTNSDPYRIAKIGNGLPTTSTTATVLAGIPATGNYTNSPAEDMANGFIFFDVDPNIPGNDLLYFVSELANTADGLGVGHLRKYVRTSTSGENWVFKGGISVTNTNSIANITANELVSGLRSITGTLVGGVPILYASSNSRIIKVVDDASYTSNLNAVVSSVATAVTNTAIRGIAFAPGTNVITTLSVTLASFTGKIEQNYVKLNWTTSSEKNNSHFEILRSSDGSEFSKIGRVEGSNNSNVVKDYQFKDRSLLSKRTAYYRLNQIDYDGRQWMSDIISVNTSFAVTDNLNVHASDSQVIVRFNAVAVSKGKVCVFDVSGRKLVEKDMLISRGLNEITLSISGMTGGKMYIALLDSEGNLQSEKFIVDRR